MTPGEIFLTVFVAFLAGAVTYLGITVRDLQRQMRVKSTYTPLQLIEQASGEREAHEAMKRRSAELQAAKLAMPESDWPTHAEHPLADPADATQEIPAVKPNKHAL